MCARMRAHVLLRLADRQAADRVAVEADARRAPASDSSRRSSYMPPCTMPNSALALPSCARFERSAQRSDSRIESRGLRRRSRDSGVHSSNTITMSELSTRWMRIDSSGVRKQLVAVDRRGELHALLADLAQRAQAEHLEAARVGEDRPVPAHEAVQAAVRARSPRARAAATGGRCCRARSARRAPRSSAGRHRLHRAVGADRHERRRLDACRARARAMPRRAAPSVLSDRELHRSISIASP